MKVDGEIHIHINLQEVNESTRKVISTLLTNKEFAPSLSLFRAGKRTFLETQYTRYYAAESVVGSAYDPLETLAEASTPEHDFHKLRSAFINFTNSTYGSLKVNTSDGTCMTPLWTVELHTSQLSTTEYSPLKSPVSAFKVTVHYLEDCNTLCVTCDAIKKVLKQ